MNKKALAKELSKRTLMTHKESTIIIKLLKNKSYNENL